MAYIPPEKSVYSNISIFTDIEDELNNLRSKNSNLEFCLLGDFNARTGVLCDFIDMSDDERENNNCDESMHLERLGLKLVRHSVDQQVNKYGMRLLELFKALDLFIASGRVGSDAMIGRATCKNVSVVDYAVCSANVLKVSRIYMLMTDPMLSDVDCAVCLTLRSENIDKFINHTHTHCITIINS